MVLLKQVEEIVKKYDEISKLKQERFNVFSILRKEHEEERLHSAFIAELLNVNGCHDFGSTFLKLLVDRLEITFSLDGAVQVIKEKSMEEGRADIYIRNDQGSVILIENKIDAGDQPQQLYRYHTHIGKQPCKGYLLYLTLYGDAPSDQSISDNKGGRLKEGDDYKVISYKCHIIKWLDDCLKESVNAPTLRETIKQYITLVKKLTGQLVDDKMKAEIYNRIKENYAEAKIIADCLSSVHAQEINSFISDIADAIKEKLGDAWEVEISSVESSFGGVTLRHRDWGENIDLKLEGDSKIYFHGTDYGIRAHKDQVNRDKIKSLIENLDFYKSSSVPWMDSAGWPAYKQIFNFSDVDSAKRLFDANKRDAFLNDVVNAILEMAQDCEKVFRKENFEAQ